MKLVYPFGLIVLIVTLAAAEICPDNETPTNCVNYCNTCQIRMSCTYPCTPGCDCLPGLLRNSKGECVRLEECDVPPGIYCRSDEQYYNCTPSCKNNCKNYFNPGIRCACDTASCFCKEGLIKREDGECVLPQDCFNIKCARPEEQFYECTPSCKNTCKNYFNPEVECTCNPPSCFCREGLIKNKDGMCVLPEECLTE